MARLVIFACAAVFVAGGMFGYLAWMDQAPESDRARQERLFEETAAAAKAGDAAAQLALGRMYEEGRGVRREPEKAAVWYAAAAEGREFLAHYLLGRLYEEGRGVRPDYRVAADLYRKAVAAGLADAQFALGQMHLRGRGVLHDEGAAIDLLRAAAEGGHPIAQFLLADMYRQGWGLERDPVAAYMWYTIALPRADDVRLYNPRYEPETARRDLARTMTRMQIDQAEGRAAQFAAPR